MSNFKVLIFLTDISGTECSPEDLSDRTNLSYRLFSVYFDLGMKCDFCDGSKDICLNCLTNLHV